MIRHRSTLAPNVVIRRHGRMGLVQAGDGGSAYSYSFDADGLSNDPQLAYNLQSLTPQQLQTALNGGDPLPGLIAVTNALATGQGLPCGTTASGDPSCSAAAASANPLANIPLWVWFASGGVLALLVLKK